VINCAVITGGLGGLGLLVAAWLAARGARELVLLGRSGRATPSPALTALSATGLLSPTEAGQQGLAAGAAPAVRMVRCDVSDREEVAAALAGYTPDLICHASGVLQARPLVNVAGLTHQDMISPTAAQLSWYAASVAWEEFGMAGAISLQPSVPRTLAGLSERYGCAGRTAVSSDGGKPTRCDGTEAVRPDQPCRTRSGRSHGRLLLHSWCTWVSRPGVQPSLPSCLLVRRSQYATLTMHCHCVERNFCPPTSRLPQHRCMSERLRCRRACRSRTILCTMRQSAWRHVLLRISSPCSVADCEHGLLQWIKKHACRVMRSMQLSCEQLAAVLVQSFQCKTASSRPPLMSTVQRLRCYCDGVLM